MKRGILIESSRIKAADGKGPFQMADQLYLRQKYFGVVLAPPGPSDPCAVIAMNEPHVVIKIEVK